MYGNFWCYVRNGYILFNIVEGYESQYCYIHTYMAVQMQCQQLTAGHLTFHYAFHINVRRRWWGEVNEDILTESVS